MLGLRLDYVIYFCFGVFIGTVPLRSAVVGNPALCGRELARRRSERPTVTVRRLSVLLGDLRRSPPCWGRRSACRCWRAGFTYLIASGQDLGLVTDQTMNGLYNSYLLIAIPLFIFVANVMNASGVIERLLGCGSALVGHLPGGLAQVNVVSNLIFSGMSGSAVADASGPGLIVARMMTKNGRYPRGFAAATSVASATLGPLMPTSIPMIFYALIANASVGAMLLGGLVPAALMAAALMAAVGHGGLAPA